MQAEKSTGNAISQWIISLAISVASCAVLFVIFASYIFELNEKISTSNMQLMALHKNTELVLKKLETMSQAQAPAASAIVTGVVPPVMPEAGMIPPVVTPEVPAVVPPAVPAAPEAPVVVPPPVTP